MLLRFKYSESISLRQASERKSLPCLYYYWDVMQAIQEFTDEQLVAYIRLRDEEQYREIVLRYQDKLMRYARRLTNNQDMAQDAVQQAFIKAYVNLQGFDTSKKFSSWIYRIVHNEAVNLIKKAKNEISLDKKVLENHAENTTNGHAIGLDKILEQKEQDEMLIACLQEIPVEYRAPLTLAYFEGKSYGEISDILRVPVGTVGTRIKRGKNQLKKLYLNKGGKPYGE